ncbi:MAG: RNA polymerase sigma factor [Thermoguttaceae bacterium]|nr:RNA polymerase sigma factor [Thermoguttaceae bacterium]
MKTTKKRDAFLYESMEATAVNEQQLKDFFARYEPETLGTLFFLLGSVKDAEETLDEVFMRCWKNNQIGDVKNVRVWIFRVLYSIVSEKTKKDRIRKRKEFDGSSLSDLDENSSDYSFFVRMRNLICSLTFMERVVFLLRQNGTLSYRQIAQTTGESIENVQKTMQTVLNKLGVFWENDKNRIEKSLSDVFLETSV